MAATALTADRSPDFSEQEARVAAYYGAMGLVERIAEDLERGGFDRADAAPGGPPLYGSFHIGGAGAVERLLDAMPPLEGRAVLDIGCGVGGAARALARRGAMVRGVDLTPEFIDVARALSRMVGGDPEIFTTGSALDLPYRDHAFDHAVMLHVGMNLADKPRAMAEAARVLRPGGTFAIYDILRVGPGRLPDPLPWAEDGAMSFPETAEAYLAAAHPGFTEAGRVARAEEGVAFLEALVGPAPARPISEAMRAKLANLLGAMRDGILAPVELMLTRRGRSG
jgi:SAM-dependent methyltransferase